MSGFGPDRKSPAFARAPPPPPRIRPESPPPADVVNSDIDGGSDISSVSDFNDEVRSSKRSSVNDVTRLQTIFAHSSHCSTNFSYNRHNIIDPSPNVVSSQCVQGFLVLQNCTITRLHRTHRKQPRDLQSYNNIARASNVICYTKLHLYKTTQCQKHKLWFIVVLLLFKGRFAKLPSRNKFYLQNMRPMRSKSPSFS